MSLLDDVSIVVTPNGYKAGELYAVVPVPTEGAEEITNGDFSSSTGWSFTNSGGSYGWIIDAGRAICDASATTPNRNLNSTFSLVNGKSYRLIIDILQSADNMKIVVGGTTLSETLPTGTNLNYEYFIPEAVHSGGGFTIYGGSSDLQEIDNVSVKEYTSADMDVTRATAATRVDENGLVNYALGVEEVTNGDFSNGSTDWTPFGSTFVVSNANPYNGNDTALFTASGVNGAKVTQSITTVVGSTYHLSCYAQYNSGNQTQIEIEGVLEYPNGIGVTSGVTNFTFLQTSFTATSTTSVVAIRERGGNNNASCYLYDISVKEVNNVPRIDYTGGGCPHILAEPQRTNLITYSEDFSDSSWVKSGVTLTSAQISPSGDSSAYKLDFSANNDYIQSAISGLDTSKEYTLSFYAKVQSGTTTIDAGNINGGSYETLTITDEWQRFEVTQTPSGTTRYPRPIRTNGSDEIYLWGAQLEQGSFATSYIPTSGSTVTRNQDIFSRDGIGSLINSTEGVLFVEMAALSNDSTRRAITLSDGTTSNRVMLRYQNSSNAVQCFINVANSLYSNLNDNSYTITDFLKIAYKWKAGDFALWINGTEVATSTDATSFGAGVLTEMQFNEGDGAGSEYLGKVKQLQVYTTALTDTQLAALTS